MTPHLDFHFNTIASAERSAIDCADVSKPAALPTAYTLPDIHPPGHGQDDGRACLIFGLCVRRNGDGDYLAELEGEESRFASMVVGYAHGKPIFVEPMVAKAMLMEESRLIS